MDFKIITYEKYDTEVCLHRSRGEDGEELVEITSFIFSEEQEEYILETTLKFPSAEMARSFIRDYSVESCEDWLVEQADAAGIAFQ